MERINPYAVTRNTATYEAYKAYNRETMRAGAPLFMMGIMFLPVSIPVQVLAEQRFAYARDFPLFVAIMVAPAVLCLLFTGIGVLRMRKYRREHPIPAEWRQAPRA